MDHFIGFDAPLLRVALGRGKTLRLYGPPGLIANVEGKLHGYTWNLVDGYPSPSPCKNSARTESGQQPFTPRMDFNARMNRMQPWLRA